MEIVAVVALGRNAEQEAPLLAADLGLTVYETGVMLRGAKPVIVLRSEDRTRTSDVLAKIRSRGHDAVALDLADITSSRDMFRPRTFQLTGEELVAESQGEQRRLPFASVFALVRAVHDIRSDEAVVDVQHVPAGGGASRVKKVESTRVTHDKDPVIYVFRSDEAPWILSGHDLRYLGLGREMQASQTQNFEVLTRLLRAQMPLVPYDTRLLQVRAPSTVVNPGATHLKTSSAGTLDILAYVVASALNRQSRPYR